jgi:uncharacterized membrane protein
MLEQLLYFLKGIPKEIMVVILSTLPVTELRGAMPLAVAMGVPLKKAFLLSVAGNLIPIIPILFLFEPISLKLRHFKPLARFFDWFYEHTRKKASLVEKFEALGLMLFVAIPFPGTGAWTGCIAASIFRIRFRYAVIATTLGVIGAGIIVAILIAIGKILI